MEGRITSEDGTQRLGVARDIQEEDDILRFTTDAVLLVGNKCKVIQERDGYVLQVEKLPSLETQNKVVCRIIERQPLSYDPEAT